MRSRNWSIRSKIIALVTVPLVALLALWIFATAVSAGPAFNLLSARTVLNSVGMPGVELIGQLQRERLFSVEYLSGIGQMPEDLVIQRAATDKSIAAFRRLVTSDDAMGSTSSELRTRINAFLVQLDNLPTSRDHIQRREIDPYGAQVLFNNVIAVGYDTFSATATFNDERIDRPLRALVLVGRGQEYLSRIDALVGAATVGGRITVDQRVELIQDVGAARYLFETGVGDLSAADRTAYATLAADDDFTRLDRMMDALVDTSRSGQPTPVLSTTWRPVYVQVSADLRGFTSDATTRVTNDVRPIAVWILVRLALAAVVGLIALVVSMMVSIKVGRSIVGRLGRLRAEAQEMADERLPQVVRRLQRGEPVDVDAETPRLEYGKDEIGQLGYAFNDVRRTAVQSAIEEANVRRGINEVFLNIARRSQTLLHRQLSLLDKMERRETEPDELEDLYRVDHLATRMRRHAEDLVILAGAAPGRGWRNPVPVIDVIRGAISEVEDYKRIDIRTVESSSVLGRAVGDVIHLLAELFENAASFSPPQTKVQVVGQVLPNGYAIEIEDRGLGMSAEAIEEANRRLLEPPDFDPTDSARLGLFVVSQLAHRHGIRVSLRQSAYAGIAAVVLVPADMVVLGSGGPGIPDGRPIDDQARHVPVALQRQGASEARQQAPITTNGTTNGTPVTGSPVALNGRGPGRISGRIPKQRPTLERGPAPSTVADELSADGLVQRRRNRRPVDLGSAPPPPRQAERGEDENTGATAFGRTNPSVAPTSAAPLIPGASTPGPAAPISATPISAAPLFAAPTSAPPLSPENLAAFSEGLGVTPENLAAISESLSTTPESLMAISEGLAASLEGLTAMPENPAADSETTQPIRIPRQRDGSPRTSQSAGTQNAETHTEDGLPKRVRQASLAPQLRRTGTPPAAETEIAAPRSPEQVRSLMSALQHGTARGRIDAARYGPSDENASKIRETGGEQPEKTGVEPPSMGNSFGEAATVIFPAIADDAVARGEATPGTGEPGTDGDRAGGSEQDDATRPAKDTE